MTGHFVTQSLQFMGHAAEPDRAPIGSHTDVRLDARGGDQRSVHEGAGLDRPTTSLQLPDHHLEPHPIERPCQEFTTEADEGRALRGALMGGKAAEPAEARPMETDLPRLNLRVTDRSDPCISS